MKEWGDQMSLSLCRKNRLDRLQPFPEVHGSKYSGVARISRHKVQKWGPFQSTRYKCPKSTVPSNQRGKVNLDLFGSIIRGAGPGLVALQGSGLIQQPDSKLFTLTQSANFSFNSLKRL